jgi:hypothetical protein
MQTKAFFHKTVFPTFFDTLVAIFNLILREELFEWLFLKRGDNSCKDLDWFLATSLHLQVTLKETI